MFGKSRHRDEQIPPVDYAYLASVIRQSASRHRPTPRMQAKLMALTAVPHALNNPLSALTAAPQGGTQPQGASSLAAPSLHVAPAAQEPHGGPVIW